MAVKRQHEDSSSLDMTPMIDIVFQLLIFFMVTTNFMPLDNKLDIKLPSSKAVTKTKKQSPLKIEISKDGDLFFEGKLLNLDSLEAELSVYKDSEEIIIIKAHKDTRHEDVVKVLGICRAQNIRNVGIAALLQKKT